MFLSNSRNKKKKCNWKNFIKVLLVIIITSAFTAVITEHDHSSTLSLLAVSAKSSSDIKSIKAKYTGSTEAGTKVGHFDFDVTIKYKDGHTSSAFLYNVLDKPTLKAGKTYKVRITYSDFKTKVKIKCTTLTAKQARRKAVFISYKKLCRNPNKYKGKTIKFKGQVNQIVDEDDKEYKIAVTNMGYGFYDNDVYVVYKGKRKSRILEDDIVTFYGTFNGLETYTTILGAKKSVPNVTAYSIVVH